MMKIGIMTFFRSINYGAYLQAYALSHRLNQEENIDAQIINFYMPLEDDYYKQWLKPRKNIAIFIYNWKRAKTFKDALSLQTISSKECCSNKIEDFIDYVKGKYDIIIAGSDEIWNVNGIRGFPTPYFLPGNLDCKKMSYAAGGMSSVKNLSNENIRLLKDYLNDFDYIGVRDAMTYNGLEPIINQPDKLHINFDPIFVYDFKPDISKGKQLIRKYFHVSSNKKIIVMLYSEKNFSKESFSYFFKDKYQPDFEIISIYQWSSYFKNSPLISPLDLIDIIAAVDGVISMFYHPICIAIITGTPFFAIERRSTSSDESKLYDLLKRLNLLDFYILGTGHFKESINLNPFISEVLNGERNDFSCILKEARDEFVEFINELKF